MARFELKLFGSPQLLHDGQLVEIDARKTMALLAYLSVTNVPHTRESLLYLLWPDLETRRAQNVLRRNLSNLNKSLNGQWLAVNMDQIGLDGETDVRIDTIEFQRLSNAWNEYGHRSDEISDQYLDDLIKADEWVRGPFMEGFAVRNSSTFDDWQLRTADELSRQHATILHRIMEGYRVRGAYKQAIRYAHKAVHLDPLNEQAQRNLMLFLHRAGDRAGALAQYHACVRVLDEELGAPPSLETDLLYQQIQSESPEMQRRLADTFVIPNGDTPAGMRSNLIGSGAMGNVYKGTDLSTGQSVAIKLLKPEVLEKEPSLLERFIREGEILKELNHPNIVKMLASFKENDQHYLVMEYVGGGSLAEYVRRRETLPIDRLLHIALDLADALTRAHTLSIIHRDLKPSNILMTENGQVRLSDFGIARQVDKTDLTQTGQIVGTINYISPEALDGHIVDERSDIWSFGVMLFELLSGKHPFRRDSMSMTITAILADPPPDLGELRPDVPQGVIRLIEGMLHKDPTQRIPSVRVVGAELEALLADRTAILNRNIVFDPTPPPCPYQGLFAFQVDDAPYFFGRETFTRKLVDRVRHQPLTAVVGPSGSGKSSVVFAGLMDRIHQDTGWLTATMRPGADPFQSLASILIPLLQSDLSEMDQIVEVRKLASGLQDGTFPLIDVIQRIVSKAKGGDRLLLVADQFEELYTLCTDDRVREAFLDVLLDLIELQPFQQKATFAFVLTLRADFFEQALAYRPFADVLQDSTQMLGPMHREELTRAIEEPAKLSGVTFETGLVERVLDDVGEEAGNLPLLEFALTTLWEHQAYRILTHRSYDDIGRVAGALTSHAEQFFSTLGHSEQESVHRAMIQLVKPGEGTEDTRRVAQKTELGTSDWSLIQKLADARLVITAQNAVGVETVEVVHEALIRNWDRLQEWMSADRTFRIWQEKLRSAEAQWRSVEEDEGALLRGLPLSEAENWLSEQTDALREEEARFIQASIDLREREAAIREKARRDRERLRQQILSGTVIGLILTLGLAVFAGVQWNRSARDRQFMVEARATASAERDLAQFASSRQLATLSSTLFNTDFDLSVLMSVESTYIAETGEARNALRSSLLIHPRLQTYYWGPKEFITALSFSPDGNSLAASSNDNAVYLWDVETGEQIGLPLNRHTDNVLDIAFHPNERIMATAGVDKSIILWNMDTGEPLDDPWTDHAEHINELAFSPDGQTLISVGGAYVGVWNLTDPDPRVTLLEGHSDIVRAVIFSDDGRRLATGGNDRSLRIWDAATGDLLSTVEDAHEDWVRSIAFSPDQTLLASASEDGVIRIWRVADELEPLQQWAAHEGSIRTIAFSPQKSTTFDGYPLASAGIDQIIQIWDPVAGESILPPLAGHTGWIRDLAFSPDGTTLASGSHDRSVILWDITGEIVDPLLTDDPVQLHQDSIRSIVFQPNAALMVSGGDDQTIRFFDLDSRSALDSMTVTVGEATRSLAVSPSGQYMAMGGEDGTVLLWEISDSGNVQTELIGHTGGVQSVAFSMDERLLASASEDGSILFWEIESREQIGPPLTGHVGGVEVIQFGPNGTYLASGGEDNSIILWDVSNLPSFVARLQGHNDVVFDLEFSPDGRILYSGSWDRTVRSWDIVSGNQIGAPLTGHLESVQTIAINPNGDTLASGSWDETIILWDLETGEQLGAPLRGHNGSIRALAFNPDGTFLVSSGDDGRIFVWYATTEAWRIQACQRVNRNLTVAEWQRIFGSQPYRPTCLDPNNTQ